MVFDSMIVSLINRDIVIIRKDIILKTMETMKIWLVEYAVFYQCSFIVKHSDENKHYVITCRHGCPWTVHARKAKDDNWMIPSVVQPHTRFTNVDDRKHAQLSSRFISQRLVNINRNCPLMTVTTLIKMMIVAQEYHVKYGRAWRAEAYERLPAMLHAMKAKNLGMHFEYVLKPDVMGPEGRQYFFRAFWTFEQCVEAFKYCCDVLSIDSMFLMGNYEGTILIAIGIDTDHQLVPLAFAIMKENNGSCG
jgi:hypothetical protein